MSRPIIFQINRFTDDTRKPLKVLCVETVQRRKAWRQRVFRTMISCLIPCNRGVMVSWCHSFNTSRIL